ncbi:MAG TPA: histidinol-phosphate transaminase, partial [Candidatus Acidoferrales bacterium]|nr:histidinol-phosphate transaminase [Candidatus Acidoferrales bacterium]
TNGTDDALHLVADAFVAAGSTVLLVEPTFAMYRFYAELAGARILSLHYDRAMRFPLEGVRRALRRRPRVFFLANPNNPTGTLVDQVTLEQILKAAPRTLVVVDEAYAEFSGVTILPGIRRHSNLIVTRTFSKAAGLAGLRVGCLLACRRLADVLRKAHSPYPVSSAALVAAAAATRDIAYIRRYAQGVARSRRKLAQVLAGLGIRAFPSAANFILADFGRRAPGLLRALRRQGILLRDRQSDFGSPGYVRITIGTPAQVRRLIRALERWW